MKVILINLPAPHLVAPDAQVPLGILYLAAVLEDARVDVQVKNYAGYSINDAFNDSVFAHIYGITATSMQTPVAEKLTILLRDKFPRSEIILGGPACIDLSTFNNIYDATFYGDSECSILNYIDDNLQSHYTDTVNDLDNLPFPARHLVDFQGGDVFAFGKNYYPGGSTQLCTSRGCPFNCAFCAHGSRVVRERSPENIVEEMEQVVTDFGIRQFRINDDFFMQNPDRVNKLCRLIKRSRVLRRLIAWRISTRVKPCDEKLLREMRSAGLREVSIGVESFDDYILEKLNKGVTVDDSVKMINTCMDLLLNVRILLMVNTPFQRRKTIEINKNYLTDLDYTIAAITRFKPLPGSDIWNNPDKYEIKITDRNMANYNFYAFGQKPKRVFEFLHRSTDEVEKESEDFINYAISLGKINRG